MLIPRACEFYNHFIASTLKHILQKQQRQRHHWKNMESSVLEPPSEVRGMLVLNREAFRKSVQIPRLRVREEQANRVMPLIKKLLLKMEHLRPVRVLEKVSVTVGGCTREILLHPLPVKSWECLPTSELEKLEIDASHFCHSELELGYANWRADEIFKSVLPNDGQDGLTSYSRIGHIVHLNLRDHLLPYKSLIGEVLRDKVPGCRSVVNKASTIDNTYRNFQLELICGDADYQVETKENGVPFEFDFSLVYWNPRLSTEHERIVQMLQSGDVLYDVFAGVGPFSVPAAKKRCTVLANDLNPESFRWLQHNVKRNKCAAHAQLFNKDGREFILEDVKKDLLKRWSLQQKSEAEPTYTMHITMNLPAMAVEFLDVFRGLFRREVETAELNFAEANFSYPIVHVYSFAKGEDTKTLVRSLVEQHLGLALKENLQGIHFVRNVAPNKDMYRVSFRLTAEILTTSVTNVDNEDVNFIKEQKYQSEDATHESTTRKRAASTDENETETSPQCTKVKCN